MSAPVKRRPSSKASTSYRNAARAGAGLVRTYGAVEAPAAGWRRSTGEWFYPRLLLTGRVATARCRVLHPLYGRAAAPLFRENHEVSLAAARRNTAAELAAEADGRLLQGPAAEPPKALPRRTASRRLQIAPAGFTVRQYE